MIRHRVWHCTLCVVRSRPVVASVVIGQEESRDGPSRSRAPGASKTEAAGDERPQPPGCATGGRRQADAAAILGGRAQVAFHRSGEHEWSDHRARGVRKGPEHLVGRHGVGWTAQDHEQRHLRLNTNSTGKRPCRSGTCRWPRPIRISCGWERAKRIRATAHRGATGSTSRPDGGKTWKNMGLKQSFQIGRIAIHPQDPNIVYVGAWDDCGDRTRNAVFTRRPMRGRRGRRSCMSTTRRA